MQTTPETNALLAELYDRSTLVAELDGPQLEAWVSGLFAIFDEQVGATDLVRYCSERSDTVAALLCRAVAELTTGLDDELAVAATAAAQSMTAELPPESAQIGASEVAGAWTVTAPFGKSIVLGFDNPVAMPVEDEDLEPIDLRHSILVEIDDLEQLVDLQLAGPPRALVDEAAASDDRVVVAEIDTRDAAARIIAAWPTEQQMTEGRLAGPGVAPNQQFVRRRIAQITGTVLGPIVAEVVPIDIRRGLDDAGYADANRAARSTLQAAVGLSDDAASSTTALHRAWIGAVHGDGGDVSDRERDALLWLEWADWLGVGIGLLRGGSGAPCDGASFVDYVNRCPEVSSTIDKADRDYAEWAFEVAIDLLIDDGIVTDGSLTPAGHEALGPALVAAWL